MTSMNTINIWEAAYLGHLSDVQTQIEAHGVDIDNRHPINGTTPLYWAVKGGYKNVIEYLLSKKADPFLKSNLDVSPYDLVKNSPAYIQKLFNRF